MGSNRETVSPSYSRDKSCLSVLKVTLLDGKLYGIKSIPGDISYLYINVGTGLISNTVNRAVTVYEQTVKLYL